MTTGEPRVGRALRHDLRFGILTWVGIINQLTTTQANRLLANTELPFTQFIMLNHFSHQPDEGKTVSGIARAMQQPQPGTTKTVQKLLAKGFLNTAPNPADGRSQQLFLTDSGHAAHAAAIGRLAPGFASAFADWNDEDMMALFALLDRLKSYLDDNRLEDRSGAGESLSAS